MYPSFKIVSLSVLILFSACSSTKTNGETAVVPKSPAFSELLAQMPPRSNEDSRASANALVMQNIGTAIVAVSYGRPSVKGRTIFGGLEKWGSLWRAGANEATVFALNKPAKINGQLLAAGTYALFMVPNQNTDWEVVLNKVADQWGAFNHQPTQDVLRFTVRPEAVSNTEILTFSFEEVTETAARLQMKWEKVSISIQIRLD